MKVHRLDATAEQCNELVQTILKAGWRHKCGLIDAPEAEKVCGDAIGKFLREILVECVGEVNP